MREKEAREIFHSYKTKSVTRELMHSRRTEFLKAVGYLECHEKAERILVKALKEIPSQVSSMDREFQAKEALAEWEKEK